MKIQDPLARRPPSPALMAGLLVTLAALGLPHLSHLGIWPLAFFFGTLLWRLAAIAEPRILPGRGMLITLTLAGLGLVLWSLPARSGHVAGSALLLVMLGLKQLESRHRRDLYLSLLLGHFLILTQFLFEQGLGLALYLFGLALVLLALQIGLSRDQPPPRAVVRSTGLLALGAGPLAVLLFLFFPRLDAPLWRIELDGAGARTGISGEMRLGEIGWLARSDAVAFRVRFLDQTPPGKALYWRGPVLWRFDGHTWWRRDPRGQPPALHVDLASRVRYEITQEPSHRRWVFPLDLPAQVPAPLSVDADWQTRLATPLHERRTFSFASWTRYALPVLSAEARRTGLQLPQAVGPRTRALAMQWRREHPGDDAAVVEQALRFFHEQPFVYTLSPGVARGDPIEHFLFTSRRGFCEHYAASFAVLMRLAGIPARIVTGYQGGSYNPLAEYWVVRQSDAHAWVEVWLPEKGWTRIDPTAAVAPQRVERGIDGAASAGDGQVVFLGAGAGWWSGLMREGRWLLDAIDLGWYRWVLGFDTGTQRSLLAWLGLAQAGGYVSALLAAGGGMLFAGLFWLLTRLPRRRHGDPLQQLWTQFRERLQRGGLALPDWTGPLAAGERARARWPEQGADIDAFVRGYITLRYGRTAPSRERLRALRRQLRRLRLSPPAPTG
jgi:transglutaminase-like putative cysteine protease